MSTEWGSGSKHFETLSEKIKEQISSGVFKPGDKVGTETGFVRETGLSRNFVRRAIDLVIDEGLVERRPGKGIFVVSEKKQNRIVQVVVPRFAHNLYHRITQGVQDACREKGLLMQVQDAHGHVQDDLDLVRRLPEISDYGAIIVAAHHPSLSSAFLELQQQNYPFVVLGKLYELPAPTVLADNYRGGYLIGEELARLGHKHIAAIIEPEAETSRDRLNGLRDALNDAGIIFNRSLVEECLPGETPQESMQYISEVTQKVMNHTPRPTAVFYWCDTAASYGCRALRELGMKIPEDVSVIGFGDDELCEWLTPPLATVRQPLEQMGEAALDLLLELIERKQQSWPEKDRILPVELKVRPSIRSVK